MKKDYKNIILLIVFVVLLGISINVYADNIECNAVISKDFLQAMNDYVYKPIKYAVPVLLLVLTSFDFAQVVFGGKKDNMDKAKNNFLKRAVAGVIIFFIPDILSLIFKFINNQSMSACLNQITK